MPFTEIATLSILDWSVCVGGRHITGEISYLDEKVELEKHLTLAEAKIRSEEKDRYWLAHERIKNQFDTYEEIERAATKWCEDNIKSPDWLLQYYSDCNPQRPIAAKGYYITVFDDLKDLAESWDKVSNYVRDTNKELRDAVYKAYYALVRENI